MITSINKMPVTMVAADKTVKEPKIVKIAKLSIILSDKDTDIETKIYSVKTAVRMGYITEEEARQLLMFRSTLENYFDEDDE